MHIKRIFFVLLVLSVMNFSNSYACIDYSHCGPKAPKVPPKEKDINNMNDCIDKKLDDFFAPPKKCPEPVPILIADAA